jgi:hypothetical protein
MSRSGYTDDMDDQWALIRWRGAVASAIRGKRGQAFLREMRDALDAIPDKCLVAGELELNGEVCALGAVGLKRGIDMTKLDPEDYEQVADAFGINGKLAREIMYENDEAGHWKQTPQERWERVRLWVVNHLTKTA